MITSLALLESVMQGILPVRSTPMSIRTETTNMSSFSIATMAATPASQVAAAAVAAAAVAAAAAAAAASAAAAGSAARRHARLY